MAYETLLELEHVGTMDDFKTRAHLESSACKRIYKDERAEDDIELYSDSIKKCVYYVVNGDVYRVDMQMKSLEIDISLMGY